MITRDVKIFSSLSYNRNHKIAYCRNVDFPHPKLPKEDSRLLKPLSIKMASEADKEAPLNDQSIHSRLMSQAFLKSSACTQDAMEIVRTHYNSYIGNLRQRKVGERTIRKFTSVNNRFHRIKNIYIKSVVLKTKQSENPTYN